VRSSIVRRTAPLYDTAGRAMDEIKRKCAHWRAELEIADWAAERELEGASVRGRRLSPEQAEVGGRLLRRSDRLGEAISTFYKATESFVRGSGGRCSQRSTRPKTRWMGSWSALEQAYHQPSA
jgi:hypothetical protein